jgi:hypothetical protein
VTEGTIQKKSYLFAMYIGIQLLDSLKTFVELVLHNDSDTIAPKFSPPEFTKLSISTDLWLWVAHKADTISKCLQSSVETKCFDVEVQDICSQLQERSNPVRVRVSLFDFPHFSAGAPDINETADKSDMNENLCTVITDAVEWCAAQFGIDVVVTENSALKQKSEEAVKGMITDFKIRSQIDW